MVEAHGFVLSAGPRLEVARGVELVVGARAQCDVHELVVLPELPVRVNVNLERGENRRSGGGGGGRGALAETRRLREALRLDVVVERAVVVALLLEVRRDEVAAGQTARLAADLERLHVACVRR